MFYKRQVSSTIIIRYLIEIFFVSSCFGSDIRNFIYGYYLRNTFSETIIEH